MIMKAKDFRAFLAELGSLTPVQRNALMAALSSRRSAGDVVALIEAEFAKAPACSHCGSEAFSKWGVATGLKRYMCKACERTFNALTGTPLAHLQKREKWLEYARAIVDGLSLRMAAQRVGVHLETSFRWRHRFLATSKGAKATAVTGIVEADETFIRKSAKGSKRLVGRAPRKRGTPTRGSTFRTSMPTPAASRTGCDHSRASHPGICRTISAGAAQSSGSAKTSPQSAACRLPIAASQHEDRTEPTRQPRDLRSMSYALESSGRTSTRATPL
jgi:transposase-like protein